MVELSEKDFDRIERFILGTLSAVEQQKFKKELESNPDLQKALDQQKQLINAVEAEGLKADLDSIHHELYESTSSKNSRPLYFSIAASVAVLIGFSFWYFGQRDSQAELYAQYSYTDPGLPVPMSATDSYDFYDAMVDYKTEDYQVAIGKWEILLEEEPLNDTLNYYIGASYFNMDAFDQAKPYLDKILNSPKSNFVYKAQYMLFLAEVRRGNTEEALKFRPLDGSPFKTEINAAQESLGS
jgi:tetratricopeptide (TPR) repeat protein